MKTSLTALIGLTALAAGASLLACSADDGSEPASQAEAQLVAEPTTNEPVADEAADDRAARHTKRVDSGTLRPHCKGKRHGRRGHFGRMGPPNPEKFIERFDKDGNGTVEIGELPGRMGEKMAKLDGDGNGTLTRDELRDGMRARGQRRFEKKDANGDGFLTADEIGERRWSWLAAADADGDQRLTFDEIAQGFESGALQPPRRGRHGKHRDGDKDGREQR